MTDAQILQLLTRRQEVGLAELKSRYEGYCAAIASRILTSREDAQEVVNDVWLRAWEHIPADQPQSLGAYLARITRNLALDRYRQNHSARRGAGEITLALEELSEVVGGGDAAQAVQARELAEGLDRFLEGISQRDRSIFLRRYFYLETDAQIAQRHGLHPSSVRTVLSRTRKRLKTYLKKEGLL